MVRVLIVIRPSPRKIFRLKVLQLLLMLTNTKFIFYIFVESAYMSNIGILFLGHVMLFPSGHPDTTVNWAGLEEVKFSPGAWVMLALRHVSAEEIAFSEDGFQLNSSGGNKGYIDLGEYVGGFGVSVHHWLVLRGWQGFIFIKMKSRCLLNISL